jgi:hypothetical protein
MTNTNTTKVMQEWMEVWKKNMDMSLQSVHMMQEYNEKLLNWMTESTDQLKTENKKMATTIWENMRKNQDAYQENLQQQMEKVSEFFSKTA